MTFPQDHQCDTARTWIPLALRACAEALRSCTPPPAAADLAMGLCLSRPHVGPSDGKVGCALCAAALLYPNVAAHDGGLVDASWQPDALTQRLSPLWRQPLQADLLALHTALHATLARNILHVQHVKVCFSAIAGRQHSSLDPCRG